MGGDCPSLALYLGRFWLRSEGLMWSSNLALCFAEPQELHRIILQWFCVGNLCLDGAGTLSPCHLEQGGHSLGMVPAGERCEEKAWLVSSRIGFDLKAKAPAGLESPPGVDVLDVMNIPVLQWECGWLGRREAWGFVGKL